MKDLIPRQQFDIAIQAAIGTHIIARSTVKQLRKNVLAKCYGGDISRKKKASGKTERGKEAHASGRKCGNSSESLYECPEAG